MAVYTDLDISFALHPSTKDVLKLFDVSAAKFALKNVLMTVPGEKTTDMDFGIGLSRMQFELWTPIMSAWLKRKVTEQVSIYLPEIALQDVTVVDNSDSGELILVITFYVRGNLTLQTFQLVLERAR